MSIVRSVGATQVREGPLSLLDPRVDCTLDGSGDQAAKVATAVALLPSTGGHIYQPPGTLRTSAITFDRPVRWEGAGDQASIIKAAAGFTGTLITVDGGWSRLHDVQIDGGGSALLCLNMTSGRNRLDHLHFTGGAGDALAFNGTSSGDSAHATQVSDVRILNFAGNGVWIHTFGYDQEFTNVWIGTCNVGVQVDNNDCMFTNLHVWGCTGDGIRVRADNTRFVNTYVETCGGDGFDIFNAQKTSITGGSIWKNQGHGVNIQGTSHRTRVNGVTIYDQGGNGVLGGDAQLGQVLGCSFYDDTTSTQTQDRPIATTGAADLWIVTGNVARAADHATGGISLVGAGNVLTNNIT
jgi:hypothetical protein